MALLKLALAARGGFARTDVIEFLSLADLDPSACGCPDGDPPVGEWNAVSTLAGVTSGAEQWRERVSSLAGRLEGADAEDPFAEAHAGLAAPAASLRNVVERTLGPLASSRPRATLDEYLHELTEVFRDVTRDTQERDTVLSAVARMAQVSELAGEVSFSYFCELLREYLDAPAPRGSRFGTGGPYVLSSMSARGLSYRVVVVPGLVEKQFPLHRRQDPILLDHEREGLNRQTGMDPLRRLPPRGPGTDEERLLFRLAVGAASETVIVTYPRLDPATARPRVPSAFVLDVLERLSGRKQDYASLETSEHVLRVPLSRRFPASRDRALTRHEFDGCSVLSAVATGDATGIAYLLSDEGQLKRRVEMEETRWSSPFFTKYDGALSFPEALAAAAACSGYSFDAETPGRAISATALEEYATCPFRFLAHHVLGIEPPDEPEDALEFTPLDRGSLYHDVLEKFMRRMLREDRLPLDESSLDTLLRMAADAVESGRWSLAGYEGARRLELRSLRLLLALWLRAEQRTRSPLLPSYFEVRFGGAPRPGDDPTLSREEPLGFDAGEGVSIPLAGRIDRIDATANGSRARVVDYKTGNPKNVSKPLDRGRHLQLPVYLLAADELLADRGATTESAEYHFITNRPGARTKAFTRDDMDERLDDVRAALRCIVRGIETGMFFPYPESKGACRNCDYAPACGPVALALAQMKYGDPNAEFFFVELEEIK